MWIDALCGNPKEQSRQVAYMSHIYWAAPRVVVWLGPGADASELALETLRDIGSRIRVGWLMERMAGVTELGHQPASYFPQFGLSRAFFIVQEWSPGSY